MNPKDLTSDNYLERDERLNVWSIHGIGHLTHSTDDWVKIILSVEHSIALPPYLEGMFDRARSCMAYGCLYYPLFTLGIEESYRYLESALNEAVKESGAEKVVQKLRYVSKIDWLTEHNFMDEVTQKRWHAARSLRNGASHKSRTTIMGPNDALNSLKTAVELIEDLFGSILRRAEHNV